MTTALTLVPEGAVVPITPQQQINEAADMARILKEVVTKAGLSKRLGGKKEHLEYEAWATIARWFNSTPITEWTRPIKDGEKIIGWEARVNVVDGQGRVIGSSEGMCMADEPNWRGKPSYALRSMAQTRTAGKALRSLFAHIAVLAGYSPTPAEEMDGVEIRPEPTKAPTKQPTKQAANEDPEAWTTEQRQKLFGKCKGAGLDRDKAKEFADWALELSGLSKWTTKYADSVINDFDELMQQFQA
jgi:hypothetical protein